MAAVMLSAISGEALKTLNSVINSQMSHGTFLKLPQCADQNVFQILLLELAGPAVDTFLILKFLEQYTLVVSSSSSSEIQRWAALLEELGTSFSLVVRAHQELTVEQVAVTQQLPSIRLL